MRSKNRPRGGAGAKSPSDSIEHGSQPVPSASCGLRRPPAPLGSFPPLWGGRGLNGARGTRRRAGSAWYARRARGSRPWLSFPRGCSHGEASRQISLPRLSSHFLHTHFLIEKLYRDVTHALCNSRAFVDSQWCSLHHD